MPLSTQSLYFHLSMRADDDGFINNPKKIQRMVGCGDDDLKLLMAKRFILVLIAELLLSSIGKFITISEMIDTNQLYIKKKRLN